METNLDLSAEITRVDRNLKTISSDYKINIKRFEKYILSATKLYIDLLILY